VNKVNRREIVLAALAAAKGDKYTPVQVQKLLFLIDRNLLDILGGPHFNFAPYNYGPFDISVYEIIRALQTEGYVEVDHEKAWKSYRLTIKGQKLGYKLLNSLPKIARNYIIKISEFVRSLTFTQLVSAIYKAYPDMRANSVFQE
jgi:hypothetical protein